MRILPVLDLMNGLVVRGVAGERESYQPVQSVLTSHCDPLSVAGAFQAHLGLSEFYVADLDGIQYGRLQISILLKLAEAFPGLWLDCGIRGPDDIPESLTSQEVIFVAGLESIPGPETLMVLCKRFGPPRIVFSLDLKAGLPLGHLDRWDSPLPLDIAREAVGSGVQNLIVLDLAQVGVSAGLSTLPLCRQIKREFPDVRIITGGGIRHIEDLIELKQSQMDGALVASAFHNGNLGHQELQQLGHG